MIPPPTPTKESCFVLMLQIHLHGDAGPPSIEHVAESIVPLTEEQSRVRSLMSGILKQVNSAPEIKYKYM